MIAPDRFRGALLGLALGDAMGAPVDGMSHQNVRTHYRGVKGLVADEKRGDVAAGQWTIHTQRARALARALGDFRAPADVARAFREEMDAIIPRRPTAAGAAAAASPAGIVAAARGVDDTALARLLAGALGPLVMDVEALSAALGQSRAVAMALQSDLDTLSAPAFLESVAAAAASVGAVAVPARLRSLMDHLGETPLDLQDRCAGTGPAADEAFPFAVAMFAREPALVDATLLSAVNVGGAASAVGAMTGTLLGAFNGWRAFPEVWRAGLENVDTLLTESDAFTVALGR